MEVRDSRTQCDDKAQGECGAWGGEEGLWEDEGMGIGEKGFRGTNQN